MTDLALESDPPDLERADDPYAALARPPRWRRRGPFRGRGELVVRLAN